MPPARSLQPESRGVDDADGDEADGRIRVLLLLSSLHGGGAERVAVNLLNGCDPARFDVRMGLLRRAGPYLDDVDPGRIDVAAGGGWLRDDRGNAALYRPDRLVAGAVQAPRALAALVRRSRPHVAVSFLKGLSLAAWPAMGLLGAERPRWLAREGNNALAVIDGEVANPLGRRVVKSMLGRCYRAADGVLANSADMAEGLRRNFRLAPERVHVAPNPIDLARIEAGARVPLDLAGRRPFIVTAGRLEPQKGQSLLLRAFAASRACDGLDLVILGEGSLKARLQALAVDLGVAERVRLQGFAANPWAWFARSLLFVLPSFWEGFPNALLEAMACGAPVVASACDYGPREAIDHGRSGLLTPVGDIDALAAALDAVLSAPQYALALGAAAKVRAHDFGLTQSIEAYSAIFAAYA
ncbi:glycosyltransferase [Caulobacter sp. S45]|uniref:glycosyltransferase n=1 Tax=Caulobacter sp. S45 TaxID=1641861 RepID=UPI001577539B|nr:glycosyltransferase [Caulobacter sp. S45]